MEIYTNTQAFWLPYFVHLDYLSRPAHCKQFTHSGIFIRIISRMTQVIQTTIAQWRARISEMPYINFPILSLGLYGRSTLTTLNEISSVQSLSKTIYLCSPGKKTIKPPLYALHSISHIIRVSFWCEGRRINYGPFCKIIDSHVRTADTVIQQQTTFYVFTKSLPIS